MLSEYIFHVTTIVFLFTVDPSFGEVISRYFQKITAPDEDGIDAQVLSRETIVLSEARVVPDEAHDLMAIA